MTEFSSIQLKTIDQYRAKHNISYIISNEAVAEQIIAEMKASGVSYAGFESLITEIGSKPVIPERERERERVPLYLNMVLPQITQTAS